MSFHISEEGIYITQKTPYFYYLDQEVLDEVYEKLSQCAYNVEECREHYFSGTINVRDGQNTILTTIPYDKGWIVTANEKKVESYETLDALLAFDLENGNYELELRYMPAIYVTGFWLFVAGISTLTIIMLTEFLIKKKKKAKADNILPKKES